MIKININYKDRFTNEDKNEIAYFDLSERELAGMGLKTNLIEDIMEVTDVEGVDLEDKFQVGNKAYDLLTLLDRLLAKGYGRRIKNSLVKTDEIREEFEGSGALTALSDELFKDVANGGTRVSEVLQGMLPASALEAKKQDTKDKDENTRSEENKTESEENKTEPEENLPEAYKEWLESRKNENQDK